MNLNMIVAAGKDGAIGKGGDLVWHIREDLRRFKALTTGHPVVMGRKTWESLPKRPLPLRRNIVVSQTPGYEAPGADVASSPEEALAMAGPGAFVIGGARIYEALFPMTSRIFLTEIDAEEPLADARIQFPPEPDVWRVEEVSPWETAADGLRYRFVTYSRIGSES